MEPHGKNNRLVSMLLLTAAKPCLSVKAKPVKAARELRIQELTSQTTEYADVFETIFAEKG